LKFDGVVDTPRRARASIAESAKDKVGLRRQLIEIFFRRPLLRRELAPFDDAGDAILFAQQLFETLAQLVRVRLAVIEQSDYLAAQIAKLRQTGHPRRRRLRFS